jgi:hypothetical protein
MNLNRKAHGARTSIISSQVIDSSTPSADPPKSYPLATGYWSLREKELGA